MKTQLLILLLLFSLAACSVESDISPTARQEAARPSTGKAGSLARFSVVGDKLYTVSDNQMRIFDVHHDSAMVYEKEISLGNGIETIFPYNNLLFLGTQTGMLIYDVTNPSNPEFVSTYQHVQACDPVVVQGDYAFVTVRSGTRCRTISPVNELYIINIKNPRNPVEEMRIPLTNPYGLGIDGDALFVCDGRAGLKVFNVAQAPDSVELTHKFPGIQAYDVIPDNNLLLLIAKEGFYQYQYTPSGDMELLSKILVEQ